MRIFSAVRHSLDPRYYYGGLWSGNFHPALRRLGHEVIESQVDLLPASRFMHLASPDRNEGARSVRAAISDRLLDEVRQAHRRRPIDLFLSYFYNAHCAPAAIREIRGMGIPTVNFYCNSMHQFEHVAEVAPACDYSWHPEKNASPFYKSVGANPVWVQMGADPECYRPIDTGTRRRRACFVGQRYCDRDRWLAMLVRNDIPVDIYGSGWTPDGDGESSELTAAAVDSPHPGSFQAYLAAARENIQGKGWLGGSLRTLRQGLYAMQGRRLRSLLRTHAKGRAADLAKVFGLYEVVLNFSNVWADGRPGSQLIPHVRLRDFEAPMCRSCYITGHSEEIKEFYEVGREIDTYRTPEEFVDKVRFYLREPAAADRVREAGYRRAQRDHTWEQRFRELLHKIRLSAAA